MKIRPFEKSDAQSLRTLVCALADYEKLPRPPATALRRLIADVGRHMQVLIAEVDGCAIGFAIYFFTYASFRARPKLYLEDLFILPEHRRAGIGKKLLTALRRTARNHGCCRLEWLVLDWNTPARRFYTKLGAKPLCGWTLYQWELPTSKVQTK